MRDAHPDATTTTARDRTMRRPRRRPRRRGLALAEALLGGVLLAAGMTVVMSLSVRAMRAQVSGEKRMVAAWLADDLLNMVVAEGPANYERTFDTRGAFEAPFEDYAFELILEDLGRGVPWRATAVVSWGERPEQSVIVETLVSVRLGDEEPPREPFEEVDRDARWLDDEELAP
jgi:hypothetical protein